MLSRINTGFGPSHVHESSLFRPLAPGLWGQSRASQQPCRVFCQPFTHIDSFISSTYSSAYFDFLTDSLAQSKGRQNSRTKEAVSSFDKQAEEAAASTSLIWRGLSFLTLIFCRSSWSPHLCSLVVHQFHLDTEEEIIGLERLRLSLLNEREEQQKKSQNSIIQVFSFCSSPLWTLLYPRHWIIQESEQRLLLV